MKGARFPYLTKGHPLPEKKATTRKPTVRRKKKASPPPEHVAVRAYFLHLDDVTAGPPDNWLPAEQEAAA